MKHIKKSVLNLTEYSVSRTYAKIKLDQNESPFDLPTNIKQKIFQKISQLRWNRYPPGSPFSLIEKLTAHTGCGPEEIVTGNGSNELIQGIIHAICDTKNPLVISRPAFSIYKRITAIMNIKSIEVPLNEEFKFDPEKICSAGKRASLILLDNPNNPTGTLLTLDEINYIARNFTGILALDEAYFEFCGTTAQSLLSQYKNMIILRTFSKAFGAAGVRLGYLMGNKDVVSQIKKVPLPFSLGIFQQAAGEILLSDWKILQANIDTIIQERERIYFDLSKIDGLIVFPSQANYIFFKPTTIKAEDLFLKLLQKKILIRSFTSSHLKPFLRMTIGTKRENDLFINTLKTILKEKI